MSTSDNTPSQEESASQGSPDSTSTSRQQSDPSREADQQRLADDSSSNSSPESRIASGAEDLEISASPSKGKQGEAPLVAGKASRDVASSGPARQEAGSVHNVPFKQAPVGDKSTGKGSESDDQADIAKGASQRYRDRYVEVMRNFRAGKLHAVVTDRIQAKSIAAEQARQSDAISDPKLNR